MNDLGREMHSLCQELFPICRSITGNGVRETLGKLKEHLPSLSIQEVPTGTKCFDWAVPEEWNINDAYIVAPDGERICEFQKCNLHVVGYSEPVDTTMDLESLQGHLHSLPDQPDAIPYVTSYYKRRWGFCIKHADRINLKPGQYRVVIDSTLTNGALTYGELLLPGQFDREVFLSTYVCHPSMANNELSGPVVTTFLAKWLQGQESRKYSYRIVFIPETIGSILYLSRNLDVMKDRIVAGFNVSCVGDDRAYSYLPSRAGNTLSDQVALHVFNYKHPDFVRYTYLDRGSDERQYCSPGVDLPVSTMMRTKYGIYPEYHTSLDDLSLVTPTGLFGGYDSLRTAIACLEANEILKPTVLCEPQLGKYGLYPTTSTKETAGQVRRILSFLAYCDGQLSLLDIADQIDVPMWELFEIVNRLKEAGLIQPVE